MRVLLLHLDGKLPNLALMRIAHHHRALGHEVTLRRAGNAADDEQVLFRGLERLVRYGVSPRHIMVYILVGYWPGETHEDRDHRRRRLRGFGALPYPMPFKRTPELVGFQRWVIGAYDKRIPWRDWMAAGYSPRRLGDRATLPLFTTEPKGTL
jgi:hypothetical protein